MSTLSICTIGVFTITADLPENANKKKTQKLSPFFLKQLHLSILPGFQLEGLVASHKRIHKVKGEVNQQLHGCIPCLI